MTDNYVQIPPNSSGLKIDTSELTVSGNTVERQRIVLADSSQSENFAAISADGSLQVHAADELQYLSLIVGQLKRIAAILETMADTHISLNDVW